MGGWPALGVVPTEPSRVPQPNRFCLGGVVASFVSKPPARAQSLRFLALDIIVSLTPGLRPGLISFGPDGPRSFGGRNRRNGSDIAPAMARRARAMVADVRYVSLGRRQSSLTRKTDPSSGWVSRVISSARRRSSFSTRTRTHQSPTGLEKSSTLAVS